MNPTTPFLPVHHHLLEFTQTHVHQVRDAIQPSHPLSSPSPPAPNRPSIRVFSNESTLLMRWPTYWSFSLSIIPSKEIPGLISFRMDWLDLLAVQGTLKNLSLHNVYKWLKIIKWSKIFKSKIGNNFQNCYSIPDKLNSTIRSKYRHLGAFPGGLVVKTPCFHCREHGFNPWSGH